MIGGFHILFNFMKAVGQHMENAGLDDVLVESGSFSQNSTVLLWKVKHIIELFGGMWWHMKSFVGSNWKYRNRERSSLQDLNDEVQFFHDPFADKHNKTVDIKISEQV